MKLKEYLKESENELKKFLKEKNKEGRRLRLRNNPKFNDWKIVGGKDTDEYILTGTDKSGRSVNIKGSEEFIKKTFIDDLRF